MTALLRRSELICEGAREFFQQCCLVLLRLKCHYDSAGLSAASLTITLVNV